MKIVVVNPILVGVPEETSEVDSNGEIYYRVSLKEPVTVRCSTDPKLPAFPAEEVYIRASALTSDKWQFSDDKKPKEGFWIDGWKLDWSVNKRIVVYQETSILEYMKGKRSVVREEKQASNRQFINELIEKAKIAKK